MPLQKGYADVGRWSWDVDYPAASKINLKDFRSSKLLKNLEV